MVDLRINREFSDKMVEYFKKRMLLNQRIIKLKYNKEQTIDLEMFLRKYNRIKNGIDSIQDVNDPVRKQLEILLEELMENYGEAVVLSESEIAEVLKIVKKLINT